MYVSMSIDRLDDDAVMNKYITENDYITQTHHTNRSRFIVCFSFLMTSYEL
jgi:hypothetical protein